jgi:hypothetical protein
LDDNIKIEFRQIMRLWTAFLRKYKTLKVEINFNYKKVKQYIKFSRILRPCLYS